jgi:hypothetical protein
VGALYAGMERRWKRWQCPHRRDVGDLAVALLDLNYARSCDRIELMYTYTIVVEPEQDGGYFVTVPALPGCFNRGSMGER